MGWLYTRGDCSTGKAETTAADIHSRFAPRTADPGSTERISVIFIFYKKKFFPIIVSVVCPTGPHPHYNQLDGPTGVT